MSSNTTTDTTTHASSSKAPRKLRILMLHGYTQSGPLFHAKTRALEKHLQKAFNPPNALPSYPGGVELSYPTAPIRLHPSDIPGYDGDSDAPGVTDTSAIEAYGWWKRQGDSEPHYTYAHLNDGLEAIATELRESGPYDGVLGFSQGGAAAGMLASLLEEGREKAFEQTSSSSTLPYPSSFSGLSQPPLKFSVSYSGFAATNPLYAHFYSPAITTPMLHFIGSVDTVVEEARSLRLVDACAVGRDTEEGKKRVVYHPGGHFLPSGKQFVAVLVGFIREVVGGEVERQGQGERKEESVEDMDVPF